MSNWQPRVGGATLLFPVVPNPDDNRFVLGEGGRSWPATAHTKSAWFEVSAGLPYDVEGMLLRATFYTGGGSGRHAMLDIGLGAAGSEVVVVPDLTTGPFDAYATTASACLLPVYVRRGTRVAVRWQGNVAWPASEAPLLTLELLGQRAVGDAGTAAASRVLNVGADATTTTTTLPVLHGYGTTAWQQISAAVPFRVRRLVLAGYEHAGLGNNAAVFEFGVGAAGSEAIAARVQLRAPGQMLDCPIDVPRGARLALRGVSPYSTAPVVLLFG